jgi:hypothetical protein
MNARERFDTLLAGGEPDKVIVLASDGLRSGPPGGWLRRCMERGMGVDHIIPPFSPMIFTGGVGNPGLDDVVFEARYYNENDARKIRFTFETPVGAIYSTVRQQPDSQLLGTYPEDYYIKTASDWKVINYLFQKATDCLTPNYEVMLLDQETLGNSGNTVAVIDKTPFQRAWIDLAGLTDAIYYAHHQTAEFMEYVEVQRLYHQKAAEITAGCPATEVLIIDNITNVVSPEYYRKFCLEFYEIYAKALAGTGKVLAVHHDGLIGHLRKEIASAPFLILDSFTIPPCGNMTLAEFKSECPDKLPFVNLPPHLAYAEMNELHIEYEKVIGEWGSKRLVIEHVEDMPPDRLEMHLNAALDVCGY